MSKPKIKISCSWECPDCHKNMMSDVKPVKCICCNSSFIGRTVTCKFVYIGGGGLAKLGHELPQKAKQYCYYCKGELLNGNCFNLGCKGSRCHYCDRPTPNNCYRIHPSTSNPCPHHMSNDTHINPSKIPFSEILEMLRRPGGRSSVLYRLRRAKENSDSKPSNVPFIDMTRTIERHVTPSSGLRCCRRCDHPTLNDVCSNPCCVEYDKSLDDIKSTLMGQPFVNDIVYKNSDRLRNIEQNIRNIKRVLSMN